MERARILVADDEQAVREVHAAILTRCGHQVDTAADGSEVAAKARAQSYDLILAHIMLPPTDGIDMLTAIKRIRPSTPVVLVTGHASIDNVLRQA